MAKTLKLTIDGMHCGGCVKRVTLALQRVEGVETVNVEVGSASVNYDEGKAKQQEIVDAIDRIGFTARAI